MDEEGEEEEEENCLGMGGKILALTALATRSDGGEEEVMAEEVVEVVDDEVAEEDIDEVLGKQGKFEGAVAYCSHWPWRCS